nr:energy transducer TonB [Sphingomonas sp. R-74633]
MLAGQAVPAPEAVAQKPVPISPQNWITDDDYPGTALGRDEYGKVQFALGVDATGKTVDCRVVWTSGFLDLDQQTCAVLLGRARFKPARDASGNAIRSIYSGTFSWKLNAGNVRYDDVPALGLGISLQKLPKDYTRPTLLRVHFGRSAKPDACRVELGSGSVALDKIACEQAMAQATPLDARINGGLRPDTRMVEVLFEVGAAD